MNLEKYKDKYQIVIGLMGPKGSGKDTIADFAIDKAGANGKLATASVLKSLCSKVFKVHPKYFTDLKDEPFTNPVMITGKQVRDILNAMRTLIPLEVLSVKDFNPMKVGVQKYDRRIFKTPREMLQYVGTELIQSIYKPFHAVVSYDTLRGKPGVWFITDIRFQHEYDHAKNIFPFFYPVRIIGRNEVEEGKEEHISEGQWKNLAPYSVIDNSEVSLEVLQENALKVFKDIKKDVAKRLSEMSEDQINNLLPPKKVVAEDANTMNNRGFVFESRQSLQDVVVRDL